MKFEVQFNENEQVIETSVQMEECEVEVSSDFDTDITVQGTYDHSRLHNREIEDAHPIEAITKLSETLDGKIEESNFLTNLELEQLLK